MLHPLIKKAYAVLNGLELPKSLALQLSLLQGEDILDLVSLAHKVKNKFSPTYKVCSIMSAKSGACKEDCSYCAQSAYHKSDVEIFALRSPQHILNEAQKVYKNGVRTFGIVTSGTGYFKINDPDFQSLLQSIDLIYSHYPDMEVCLSIGALSEETALALLNHKVVHFNT